MLNHYQPLPEGPVKQQILSLARANGVPATNVYEFDASRQSDRISANVSGMFGTTRISVTDNLLKRGTPAEAKAIVGHEIGHYVMNHVMVNLAVDSDCVHHRLLVRGSRLPLSYRPLRRQLGCAHNR